MATESGDRHTVRIGGDAAGPIVVGRDNRVEVTYPRAAAPDEPTPAPAPQDASTQNNTASGHGTVYTVMKGDLHVHHQADGEQS